MKDNENRNPSTEPDYGRDNPGRSPDHRKDEENRKRGHVQKPPTSHSIRITRYGLWTCL